MAAVPSALSQWLVGVLWSAVATMDDTRQGLQPASDLRRPAGCHFVNKVAVDVDERGAIVFLMDHMALPELSYRVCAIFCRVRKVEG